MQKIKQSLRSILLVAYWIPLYKLYSPKLYNSIFNTPAFIWYEIHKEKDFLLLVRGRKFFFWIINCKYKELTPTKKFVDAWESIYSEFVFKFPPKNYIQELTKRFEIAKMRFDAVAYNEKSLNTIANLEEEKLNSNKQEIIESDFYENCALMQKHLGIFINPLKITIFEYHNNLMALAKK